MAKDTDQPHVLERLPKESDKAFRAFQYYLDMGVSRSLRKVSVELGYKSTTGGETISTTIAGWSKKFQWRNRIEAYDNWVTAQTHKKVQALDDKHIAKWHARREQIRDTSFDIAEGLLQRSQKIMEKVDTMLTMPLIERKIVQRADGTEVHLHPADWKASDIAQFMRASVLTARQAERLATLAIDYDTGTDAFDDLDLDTLDDRTLDAISKGKIDVGTKTGREQVMRMVRAGAK